MNKLRLLLALAISTGGLAALRAADDVVIDFTYMDRNTEGIYTKSYEGAWGDWGDKRHVSQVIGKGLLINHAGSKGGINENRDIGVGKNKSIRVTYIVGNGNQATSFTFTLIDRDGTECSWDVPLQGQPKGSIVNCALDLTNPDRTTKPGKTPGLNLQKLSTWQITGNYQEAPIEVMIQKVWAIKP